MRTAGTYSNASGSYEPTLSGFSQMPEDRDRETKAIVVENLRQYDELKAIENIDPTHLKPWGWLRDTPHPETKRFVWQRRTPEHIWPEVWCRINTGARDVLFEVQLSRRDYCIVHIPIDSWTRRTCDPEAVRAAIQQDYLNHVRGVRYHATIVQQGMKSLPIFKQIPVPSFATGEAIDDVPRSFSRNPAAWVQMPDERRQYRAQQSRPPSSSPSSSYVDGYHYAHRHHHHTLESYSPAQTLVEEWPQYHHRYGRRHHYHVSQWSSRYSYSSRTLVEEDWRYEFEDDYSDASSSTEGKYSIPPPPSRSEKHSLGLTPSFRSGSEGSSIYSRDRKSWWRRILEM